MAAIIVEMASAVTTPADIGESLSGIFGCISLVAWICLLVSFLLPLPMASADSNIPESFLSLSPITRPRAQMASQWVSSSSGSSATSQTLLVCTPRLIMAFPASTGRQNLLSHHLSCRARAHVPNSPPKLTDCLCVTGALVTNLAPSAVAIGIYFCVADVILISQSLYYNAVNARRRNRERLASLQAQATEEEPLLSRRRSSSGAGGLPGSHRRHSVRRGSSSLDPLTRIVTGEDETPLRSPWLTNTLSLFAVYALGVAAWFVSREVLSTDGSGAQDPAESEPAGAGKDPVVVVGMALGYISALCYLCARIPQIIKNWREKSTEGM